MIMHAFSCIKLKQNRKRFVELIKRISIIIKDCLLTLNLT